MVKWLSEAPDIAVLLVIVSVLGLVGGGFSGGGITFNINTAKSKSNLFIILVGVVGLAIIESTAFAS